jgi:hypothetical protein
MNKITITWIVIGILLVVFLVMVISNKDNGEIEKQQEEYNAYVDIPLNEGRDLEQDSSLFNEIESVVNSLE